jgi:hypothetical protein
MSVSVLDEHALDVDEYMDAKIRAFAPVASILDPTEWHPGVRAHISINETHPGLKLFNGNPFAAIEIPGDHAGSPNCD